ncbi:3-dehydroquinate synthase [Boudabousia marimammalium]|uniref:Shikimate kinase n=1 Tax=Boudabousia marimammalium TaxID=156892 RepID=A0A1Q5PR17_9ACTO|nr:3-dehydroquinate synthase [Boudabousia marimammalium]OKL50007.1 3-dehydroquinate synthase [Boudabousia marimammalium]
MTNSQHLLLVGLPGAGKSTVAQLLGEALGMPVIDTDQVVEQIAGRSIAEVFSDSGEASFREFETQALRQSLAGTPAVISLGGGVLTQQINREILLGNRVVYLQVTPENAARRLGISHGRPLLQGSRDMVTKLQELHNQRHADYETAACLRVFTDGATAVEVTQDILDQLQARRNLVQVRAERVYSVIVGSGLEEVIAHRVNQLGKDVLVVHPPILRPRAQELATRISERSSGSVNLWEHADAESGKTVASAEAGWNRLGELNYGRDSVIVAFGGGATTDLAGFLAATWLRGVPVVMCPSTLLGMVDAAVGGKTGLNTPAGKNLVGSFYSPAAVFCDLRQLVTLAPEQIAAGMAEVLKCGYIRDGRILEKLDSLALENVGSILGQAGKESRAELALRELVTRAITVKAEVVGADFRESGLREILNFGHTFAHAIEKLEDYKWQHGFAVAVGMVYAMELACTLGQVERDVVSQLRLRLKALGLPTSYQGTWPDLYEAMLHDKKVRGGVLRFVMPAKEGAIHTHSVTDLAALKQAAVQVGVKLA